LSSEIEEEMIKTVRMLTRMIFGIPPGSLQEAEENRYLWDCFIRCIKEEIKK